MAPRGPAASARWTCSRRSGGAGGSRGGAERRCAAVVLAPDLAWPLSIGIVRAGDWASTVPDRLVAEGRYGVRLGESLEDARAAFEQALARTGSSTPGCGAPGGRQLAGWRLLLGRPARGAPAAPGRTSAWRTRWAAPEVLGGPTARTCGTTRQPGSPRCSTARATCGTRTPLRRAGRGRGPRAVRAGLRPARPAPLRHA